MDNYFENASAFTLIELLIVIAILAILAVIVLLVVNPTERLAAAHDSGRISVIVQLGKSIESYVINHNSAYPPEGSWGGSLVATGFPNVFPSGVSYLGSYGVTPCTTNTLPAGRPTYCYSLDAVNGYGALIFTKLEAKTERENCASGVPYFVYSTADHRAGTVCSDSDPTPWLSGSMIYED